MPDQFSCGSGRRCSYEMETSGIFREARVAGAEVRDVEPAVQGRDRARREVAEERQVQEVDMEVNDVELVGPLADPVEHRQMGGEVRFEIRVQPKRALAAGHPGRPGARLGAREQGDVVTELDQRVGQIGNDPFRPAIEPGRDGFVEGSDLRDPHPCNSKKDEASMKNRAGGSWFSASAARPREQTDAGTNPARSLA